MRSHRCIDEVKQVLDVALFVLVDDRGCLSLDGDAAFTLDSEFVQNLKKSQTQRTNCGMDITGTTGPRPGYLRLLRLAFGRHHHQH